MFPEFADVDGEDEAALVELCVLLEGFDGPAEDGGHVHVVGLSNAVEPLSVWLGESQRVGDSGDGVFLWHGEIILHPQKHTN